MYYYEKTIKGLLISISTIVIIIMILGIYKFDYLANQPGYDVDGNKIENQYHSEVLLKWFNLNTSNDFIVKIPDTKIDCKITDIIDKDAPRYAKGDYTVGEEKGEVVIENSNIISLNQSTKNEALLIIPFSISNQGSGVFKYLGMFKLNYNTKTISHLDSYFLGDRIKIDEVKYDGNDKLQVKLKLHSNTESMAETPTENEIIHLYIDEELKIKRVYY